MENNSTVRIRYQVPKLLDRPNFPYLVPGIDDNVPRVLWLCFPVGPGLLRCVPGRNTYIRAAVHGSIYGGGFLSGEPLKKLPSS